MKTDLKERLDVEPFDAFANLNCDDPAATLFNGPSNKSPHMVLCVPYGWKVLHPDEFSGANEKSVKCAWIYEHGAENQMQFQNPHSELADTWNVNMIRRWSYCPFCGRHIEVGLPQRNQESG